jgi:poly(beta-D-mannuronate) lyase
MIHHPSFKRALKSVLLKLVLGLLALGSIAVARDIHVRNPSQWEKAQLAARPGDTLVLEAGEWKDLKMIVTKGGSATRPLVIRAAVPGETVLVGSSSIAVKAPYVTIDGLYFTRGWIEKGCVINLNSHHGIVRNTAIVDYNPPSFRTESYWVFFEGDSNLVDRCYFKGKSNMHPLIGNSIDNSRHNSVTHSCFKNIPYNDGNGREIIRIWGYGKYDEVGTDGAFFTVDGNLFDHADGEGTETISLKSNRNLVQNNTVIGTRGGINIRRGSFNVVRENIVLGQGVDGAHGLRMSGSNNLVENNFVLGCDYGIRVSSGEYIKEALTKDYQPGFSEAETSGPPQRTTFYPQVQKLTLLNNVVIGSASADLEIGSEYKKRWPQSQMVLLPEDCLIKNNRFVRPDGGVSVIGTMVDMSLPFSRFRPNNNQYVGNLLMGGKCKFDAADKGFKTEGIRSNWSVEQEIKRIKPLTLADVGPEWVIALRQAGKFQVEDAVADAGSDKQAAKKKKADAKANKSGR